MILFHLLSVLFGCLPGGLRPEVFIPVLAQPLSPVPGRPGTGDSSASGASSRPEALMGALDQTLRSVPTWSIEE